MILNPTFPEELHRILAELEGMSRTDVHDLRVIAHIARNLLKAEDVPDPDPGSIRDTLDTLRQSLTPYTFDPRLKYLRDKLGEWYLRYQSPKDNPVYYKKAGAVPDDIIVDFAQAHNFSPEFAQELVEQVKFEEYHVEDPEGVHLALAQISAKVRIRGTVYEGKESKVRKAAKVLRENGFGYDLKRITGGMAIWVPVVWRNAAREILDYYGFMK